MMKADDDIATIAADPIWLPHRYDPGYDAVHMLQVSRDIHRHVTFLTDEYLPPEGQKIVLRRSDAISGLAPAAPLHFIFHSAFCCSTLLARAFDYDGLAMGLKEPTILNDLIGWRRRGAKPALFETVLKNSFQLLARPFGATEAVIIKPSNIVNSLAPTILSQLPKANAVLLFAPLRIFLQSIAKKEMWGRLWVRELMIGQLKDSIINLGFEDEQYLGLTDLQVAAVTWLAQHDLFAQLINHFGPKRVRSLDSETLLAKPNECLTALTHLYELKASDEIIQEIISGPAFTTHSKHGTAFGGSARRAEYKQADTLHGDEIEKVALWAQAVAQNAGVDMVLQAPLL
jgi:hypothetical protein